MRRFLAIVFLIATTTQTYTMSTDIEKEVKDTQHSYSKRAVSGGKALVTGFLAYLVASKAINQGCIAFGLSRNEESWYSELFTGHVMSGGDGGKVFVGTPKAYAVSSKVAEAGILISISYLLLKLGINELKHAIGTE